MTTPLIPDADGLVWGYSREFWHALRDPRPPAPAVEDACKFFGFLPSLDPKAAQTSFERLARALFNDPASAGLCDQAKMGLYPLFQTPDRLVVVFYGAIAQREALLTLVSGHAKAERKRLLAEGLVRARDGFLSTWVFKTEAQTRLELENKTSESHMSRLLQLLDAEAKMTKPKPRKPR